MKKWLALVLVLALSLSLCACGGGGSSSGGGKNAIVGEWKSLEGTVVKFNKDGTGDVGGTEFTWKYDGELKTYTIAVGIAVTAAVKTENDLRFVETVNARYYHPDDHAKAYQAAMQDAKDEIAGYTDGRTKIEMGKSYAFAPGVTIKFTDVSFEEYLFNTDKTGIHVCLEAEFTADGSAAAERIPSLKYKTHVLHDDIKTYWSSSTHSWGNGKDRGEKEIKPGTTVTSKVEIYSDTSADYPNEPSLKTNTSMMISCFSLNGVDYYIDISEYVVAYSNNK